MKYLVIIGDGMADNPVEALGGLTPLQKAHIPTIDRMAQKGMVGSAINCPKPLNPGSETAILSIFGCDPLKYFTGRSPMEAAAQGLTMVTGDAAFRCNLVALTPGDMPYEERKILSHSAGSIAGQDALDTIDALVSDPEFSAALREADMYIHPSPSFRPLAVKHNCDPKGIRFIPPHDHLGEVCGQYLPCGKDEAKVFEHLMRLANKVLEHHPVTQKYAVLICGLNTLTAYFRPKGQNLLLETGGEAPITLLRLIEDVGADNLFINFDPANILMYGYGHPVDALKVFGKYVRNMHGKDGFLPTDTRRTGREAPVSEGAVDFRGVIEEFKKLSYDRYITIEREISGEAQIRDILKAKDYFEKLLSEAGICF